jgi:DNA adenine methylase
MQLSGRVQVIPFLRWAGGKRWLSETIRGLLPPKYGSYVEPFLGSGAVYFAVQPARAVLSDINRELISAYLAVRDDWASVARRLRHHQRRHSNAYYYAVRAASPTDPRSAAARFIYLNRTSFNGLYRVNRAGQFNVPVGTRSSVILPTDDFEQVAGALQNACLRTSDFEAVIDGSKEGDVVYADPPYTVAHSNNGFVRYNDRLFAWSDQERLAAALTRARERGVTIIATNASHPSISELYKGFQLRLLSRSSLMAADNSCRGSTEELLITSWDTDGGRK